MAILSEPLARDRQASGSLGYSGTQLAYLSVKGACFRFSPEAAGHANHSLAEAVKSQRSHLFVLTRYLLAASSALRNASLWFIRSLIIFAGSLWFKAAPLEEPGARPGNLSVVKRSTVPARLGALTELFTLCGT
jgi:hypothetical protein